jgi:hypothetical protein
MRSWSTAYHQIKNLEISKKQIKLPYSDSIHVQVMSVTSGILTDGFGALME